MATKKGLGKGLSALLPDKPIYLDENKEKVTLLPLSQVTANPQQPRREFDQEKLLELAASIKEYGIVQPIIVQKPLQGEQYMIVAGERRWRAAQTVGLQAIPCIIRELSSTQVEELSLVENIQRQDLQPLEEAKALQQLINNCGYTQEALADKLGKSRPYIANSLRLLNLAPQYQQLLAQGKITAGHARAVLSIKSPVKQDVLVKKICADQLSVRQTEMLAKQLNESAVLTKTNNKKATDPVLQEIALKLKERWGVKVFLHDKGGRGQLVIDYYCEDDLQRILDSLLCE